MEFVKLEDDAKTSKYILSTLKWPCHFMFMDFMGIEKTANNLSKIKDQGDWEILESQGIRKLSCFFSEKNLFLMKTVGIFSAGVTKAAFKY